MVADEFNEFFTSIGQTTVEKIQSLAEQSTYDLTKSSFVPRCHLLAQFSFGTVEYKEVEEVINSMPTGKAPGNDKITVCILKNCLQSILPTLTAIINDSFTFCTFPKI